MGGRKLRILWLSWRGPGHPLAGGAEQVAWRHMSAWSQAGHSITLFTSTYPSAEPEEYKNGIRILRSGGQSLGVKIRALAWYLQHRHEYDLLVDEFHGLPFMTPVFSRKPIVAFIHEVAGKTIWRLNSWPFPVNYIPAIVGPLLEPIILRYIYASTPFITVSESTKADLAKQGVHNIKVITNGIDAPPITSLSKKSKQPTCIYLSALAKDKGIEDVLRAFSLVYDRLPHSYLHIVGKGTPEYVNFLKNLSANLGISPAVKFHGYVSEAKKFRLLSQSHLLLNCSAHEGWGLVNLEANQVGTPVVGYPVAGTVDAIRNGYSGIITPQAKPEIMADEVIKLLSKQSRLKNLSNTAKTWAKKFNWKSATNTSLKWIETYYGQLK